MIAAMVAAMLITFVFIAFVLGLRYGWTHTVPAWAVTIQDIGRKTVDGEESILLMSADGWAYSFEEGMRLYLVPPGPDL